MQGNVVAAARWLSCSIVLASAILAVGFHPRVQQWGEPASQPASAKESMPLGEEKQEEPVACATTETDTSPPDWLNKLGQWLGLCSEGNVAGMTLPSPWIMCHPPQYIPPSPLYPFASELARQEKASSEEKGQPGDLKEAAPR